MLNQLNLDKMDILNKGNKVLIALIKGFITSDECEKLQKELIIRMELENIKEMKHGPIAR